MAAGLVARLGRLEEDEAEDPLREAVMAALLLKRSSHGAAAAADPSGEPWLSALRLAGGHDDRRVRTVALAIVVVGAVSPLAAAAAVLAEATGSACRASDLSWRGDAPVPAALALAARAAGLAADEAMLPRPAGACVAAAVALGRVAGGGAAWRRSAACVRAAAADGVLWASGAALSEAGRLYLAPPSEGPDPQACLEDSGVVRVLRGALAVTDYPADAIASAGLSNSLLAPACLRQGCSMALEYYTDERRVGLLAPLLAAPATPSAGDAAVACMRRYMLFRERPACGALATSGGVVLLQAAADLARSGSAPVRDVLVEVFQQPHELSGLPSLRQLGLGVAVVDVVLARVALAAGAERAPALLGVAAGAGAYEFFDATGTAAVLAAMNAPAVAELAETSVDFVGAAVLSAARRERRPASRAQDTDGAPARGKPAFRFRSQPRAILKRAPISRQQVGLVNRPATAAPPHHRSGR